MSETESDGTPSGTIAKKYRVRRYSQDTGERIIIPPSTELIPDEYEHEDNSKGLVLIFSSAADQENKEVLIKGFRDQNYVVTVNNVFPVSTIASVLAVLKGIAQENHQDKTCLIVIFMANAEAEDRLLPDEEAGFSGRSFTVKDVWSNFTGENCPSFRNKPKIFLFQASKKLPETQTDSVVISAPEGAYDIPAEADMLIVFKRIEYIYNRNQFMVQLCNNFDTYGLKDDIIGLVTHTNHENDIRPLLISTLTRKFYVTPSSKRGHYHDLHRNHDEAINLLEKLQSVNRSRIEQRTVRKWQELALGGTSAADAAIKTDDPKSTPSQSKRVSRTGSSVSSVDSKKKAKINKKMPVWKY